MSISLTPPPERDFPLQRLEQRRELLVSQIHAQQRRPQRPARRRGWVFALGATAVVAAAAIAASVIFPSSETGGASPAAAAVLRHAARAAASQPATAPPGPGQFVYTRSESVYENTAVVDQQTINFFQTQTREIWIGPDGSGRIRESNGVPRFATSADRAAWLTAGKPDLTGDPTGTNNSFGPGGLSYLDLSKLPTDPAHLEPLIKNRTIEGGPPGDAETFTIIGDLLRETYAPPALRSALYTIASQLPGVQLIGATRDHLGRPGTAVAYISHGLRHELIFDQQTSALLAEQTVDDSTGSVVDWTCYLSSGVVDSTSSTP